MKIADLPTSCSTNHACATAAQHNRYHVIGERKAQVSTVWPRFSAGW